MNLEDLPPLQVSQQADEDEPYSPGLDNDSDEPLDSEYADHMGMIADLGKVGADRGNRGNAKKNPKDNYTIDE